MLWDMYVTKKTGTDLHVSSLCAWTVLFWSWDINKHGGYSWSLMEKVQKNSLQYLTSSQSTTSRISIRCSSSTTTLSKAMLNSFWLHVWHRSFFLPVWTQLPSHVLTFIEWTGNSYVTPYRNHSIKTAHTIQFFFRAVTWLIHWLNGYPTP